MSESSETDMNTGRFSPQRLSRIARVPHLEAAFASFGAPLRPVRPTSLRSAATKAQRSRGPSTLRLRCDGYSLPDVPVTDGKSEPINFDFCLKSAGNTAVAINVLA
jgi:soluble lytic murein transglycosylase-like protein